MATVTSEKQPIPKVILRKLNRMRSQLTRWIMVHGLGRWLLAVLLVLAADMLLDRAFKMDMAQRLVMLVIMAIAALVYFGWKVIKPLGARPNDDALIYEIESKNPELKESLISSMQLSREKNLDSMGVSRELAEATIQQGFDGAGAIDFGKSLDLESHFKNWLLLAVGIIVALALGFGVMTTQFLSTWFNRNIMLLEDQWPLSLIHI